MRGGADAVVDGVMGGQLHRQPLELPLVGREVGLGGGPYHEGARGEALTNGAVLASALRRSSWHSCASRRLIPAVKEGVEGDEVRSMDW